MNYEGVVKFNSSIEPLIHPQVDVTSGDVRYKFTSPANQNIQRLPFLHW